MSEILNLNPKELWVYSVPNAEGCEARSFQKSGKPVILVLGSGPIRIGQDKRNL